MHLKFSVNWLNWATLGYCTMQQYATTALFQRQSQTNVNFFLLAYCTAQYYRKDSQISDNIKRLPCFNLRYSVRVIPTTILLYFIFHISENCCVTSAIWVHSQDSPNDESPESWISRILIHLQEFLTPEEPNSTKRLSHF